MKEWTVLKLSTAVIGGEKKDIVYLHTFDFSPHVYVALCALALSSAVISGSLSRASPSCASYANAGINHYANVTVNRYANVTVPTCQTGGQAAHKDPSSPLHFYSRLPFMIFNSLFFFSFFKLPSFLFSCFISFSSHWTVPCSHLTVYLPLLLSLLFFNFTMIAPTQRC